ncbi:bifunctional biotin--[acetyl-CoA-carboxylase] ligase/biotin operon repressor BirA [Candidatus Pantoea edessiphila]|uniref:biotin--[biotin carboxyl-carrier protein] ligase n=1 Tax=Candidatus Pantoea edessiphila TaxID=2044610 RepID=A0A2P5SWD1_9GAMM|nr:bifunctional biotin--[acetyl-CoA-carboxylase] ligase/biotin operon repressor BirA [Candidatus Pantoea edessiphila]PPI86645.1 biotin--[acetyl-CoA-carboxylase] synthetase [Candidatus Pantoea edessiphila]
MFSIPLRLIDILSNGEFYSKQNLSKILHTSESDIVNNIKILRDWGLDIYSNTEEYYSLSRSLELLDEKKIKSKLGKNTVLCIPVVDSTNQYLLNCIDNLKSGDICITEHQRFGRGRNGKHWFSPFGFNLYMSMYWQLKCIHNNISALSLVISILVAETLRMSGVKNINTKWPNDIYFYERKLAGILIEINNNKKKTCNYIDIVIGIGINIKMSNKFNKNKYLKNYSNWISLSEMNYNINRNDLIVNLTTNFRKYLIIFEQEGFTPFISRWKNLDYLVNRSVNLIIGNNIINGIARGIDYTGALILENKGEFTSWSIGETSLVT